MAYYHTCPDCGAHLDPGEKCDCKNEEINLIKIHKEETKNVRNQNHSSGISRSDEQPRKSDRPCDNNPEWRDEWCDSYQHYLCFC